MDQELISKAGIIRHGPNYVAYALHPAKRPTPVITCICGWESDMGNHSWEKAGRQLDEHLQEQR